MKLLNFIKSLLPSIEKNDVLEDLRVAIADLETNSIPTYLVGAEHFKLNKFKSKEAKQLSDKFYKDYDANGITKQKSFLGDISKRLDNVKLNALHVVEQIEKLFEHDIINDGLTVQKAVLLRTAADLNFVITYSTDLLNYVYELEASELGLDGSMAPILAKRISRNFKQFTYLISDLGKPNKDFMKILVKVPDVIITDQTVSNLESVYRPDQLDPYNSSHLAGFSANPIYHIRLSIANIQAERFKAAKTKKKLLELRLLHLKTAKEGNSNPKLEKEIDYNQSRLDKINKHLADEMDTLL